MFEIKGKVALITGGTKGIGLSIAKQLLENEAKGLALIGRDEERGKQLVQELLEQFPENAVIYINADVAQRSQFKDAFEETIKTFNQLDIVINNAGIIDEIEWEKCIAVNLQGCIIGSLLAIDQYFPKITDSSEKVILNVSSISGLSPLEYVPVYSASKHGIIGFSRSIGGPNRRSNVKMKVLVICPGITLTPLLNPGNHQLVDVFYDETMNFIASLPSQTTDELAKHTMEIIKKGDSGSVWEITGNISKEVKFPNLLSSS